MRWRACWPRPSRPTSPRRYAPAPRATPTARSGPTARTAAPASSCAARRAARSPCASACHRSPGPPRRHRVRRMATIETLNGPLDTSELGTVLMHEHIFNITAEIQIAHPGFNGWDPDVHVPAAQEELRAVKEAGIDTIVELSPIGLGRSLDLIRRAAE